MSEALAVAVAEEVVRGATVVSAAAKYGISRSKLMRWLDWGMVADAEGAGPEDTHAPYLDFFLKVLQAQGIASVRAQAAAFTYHPQWWLQNHPETRAEYGGDTSGQLLLAAPVGSAAEEVIDPSLDEETMRQVLQTLIDSGATTTPDSARVKIVDADTGAVADIPDEDEQDRQVG
jgi:hypothetical protein